MRSIDSDRYDRVAIGLHWLVALLVAGQLVLGWWMLGIAKQPPGPRADAFNLHKSIGLVVLLLMLLRAGWRARHPAPPLPQLPAWQRAAAQATHLSLYAVLLVLPIAGYLGSAWSGYPVRFFGLALPAWAAKNEALKDLLSGLHRGAGFVLVALLAVHIGAALHHAFVRRDGVFTRMLPGRRPARPLGPR